MRRRHARRSIGEQAFALRDRCPRSPPAKITANSLRWTTRLAPTGASRTYPVCITYFVGHYPKVRVLSRLATRDDDGPPHVFGDGSLCLHVTDDWNSTMLIADTTVPWAAEWLFFYELWLPTGEWYGGGEWPPRRETTTRDTDGRDA